jgi:hypothetical protein
VVQLNSTSAANSPENAICLQRIKRGGTELALSGESGQTIAAPHRRDGGQGQYDHSDLRRENVGAALRRPLHLAVRHPISTAG